MHRTRSSSKTHLKIYVERDANSIDSYVMRLGGTFFGAVWGMACWYIGKANAIEEVW